MPERRHWTRHNPLLTFLATHSRIALPLKSVYTASNSVYCVAAVFQLFVVEKIQNILQFVLPLSSTSYIYPNINSNSPRERIGSQRSPFVITLEFQNS